MFLRPKPGRKPRTPGRRTTVLRTPLQPATRWGAGGNSRTVSSALKVRLSQSPPSQRLQRKGAGGGGRRPPADGERTKPPPRRARRRREQRRPRRPPSFPWPEAPSSRNLVETGGEGGLRGFSGQGPRLGVGREGAAEPSHTRGPARAVPATQGRGVRGHAGGPRSAGSGDGKSVPGHKDRCHNVRNRETKGEGTGDHLH